MSKRKKKLSSKFRGAATRKFLGEKAAELTKEALKYIGTNDTVWALTYLRSATTVVQAMRELESEP